MDDFMEDYAREEAMAGADDVNFGAAMDATNGGDSAPFNGVEIPLRGSDEEVIVLDFDDLPDGDEVLSILKQERAPLHIWNKLAIAYYKRGNVTDFVKLLESSGSEASLDYAKFEDDQMTALDTLAAHYVNEASRERSKEKRRELFNKATLLYTTADKITMYNLTHLLGRAYFCLLEGDGDKIEHADSQFNFVINQQPKNVPALLGKACIAHQKKDYKNSLFFYKKALKLKPDCPANVRLGLAHCYAKTGRLDKARLAFERTLQLDAKCVGALVGLAIMEMNSHTQAGIRHGVQLLGQAYQLLEGKHDSMVLNLLANHFFFTKDYAKVHQLATYAFHGTTNEAMRAESTFQMARAYHAVGDMEQAFQYYFQSTQFTNTYPTFVLPWFGIGQLYIHRSDHDHAIVAFERVLKQCPDNYETQKILASLYAHADTLSPGATTTSSGADGAAHEKREAERRERRQLARELFAKVVVQEPDDAEAWIDYAQLLEEIDGRRALHAYATAVRLVADAVGADAAPELHINMGSLHYALGELDEALACFERALVIIDADLASAESVADDAATSQAPADDLRPLRVTCAYNLARVCEALCDFTRAETLYKEITANNPKYVDCTLCSTCVRACESAGYIRLGAMARNRGQLHDASSWWKEALSVDLGHLDSWSLLAYQHVLSHEWNPAQKKYESILTRDKTDAYALVGLGNIWLEQLHTIPWPAKDQDKAKHAKLKQRALDFYQKALKFYPNCIWAAHGVGCVLAACHEYNEARDIFAQVREATADFAEVWMNIAHIYVQQQQYMAAVHMYENCIRKFRRVHNVDLLLYLARAQFMADKLAAAKATLLRARTVAPHDTLVLYNLALVLKHGTLRQIADDKVAYTNIVAAQSELRVAHAYFTLLARPPDAASGMHNRHVDRHMAASEQRSCADILQQMPTHIARARALDERERQLRARQQLEREALKERTLEEERERQSLAEQQLQDLKQRRQEYIEKTRDVLFIPQVNEPERGGKSSKSRRRAGADGARDDFVNDSSDLGEYAGGDGEGGAEGGGEPRPKKSKADRRRERRQREKQSRRQAVVDEPKLSAKQAARVKSKAYVSSSDGESDGDDALNIAEHDPTTTTRMNDGSGSSADEKDRRQKAKVSTKATQRQAAQKKSGATESSASSSDDEVTDSDAPSKSDASSTMAKKTKQTSKQHKQKTINKKKPPKTQRAVISTGTSSEKSEQSNDEDATNESEKEQVSPNKRRMMDSSDSGASAKGASSGDEKHISPSKSTGKRVIASDDDSSDDAPDADPPMASATGEQASDDDN